MKATAVAHPIQGLIKYHGLKDAVQRIPFHDSISVCAEALETVSSVEFDESLSDDVLNSEPGVKRRVRVLKDHLHISA